MLNEVHITVDALMIDNKDATSRWPGFCRESLGAKPLVIRLTKGRYPLQYMLAASHDAEPALIMEYVDRLQGLLHREKFKILRTKLECPLKDTKQLKFRPAYYECHIKMDLTPYQTKRVSWVSAISGTHASTNLLGATESTARWYLTRRIHGGTALQAARKFHKALAIVQKHLPVKSMDMECVVYDSFPELDSGWLT